MALDECDGSFTAWFVILWTWLSPRVGELNSREEKLTALRERAVEGVFEKLEVAVELTRLRESSDLLGDAALTLIALERWICDAGGASRLVGGPVPGIDGETQFYLTPWSSWIPEILWSGSGRPGDHPPAVDYSPTVQILAPRLRVTRESVGGIVADFPQPQSVQAHRSLTRARQRFELIASGLPGPDSDKARPLVLHMATLGENQTAGFKPDYTRGVFVYGDPEADSAALEQIKVSIAEAVELASVRDADILVIPEFAVPVSCLPFLQEQLATAQHSPAFTVAGLRHTETDEPAVGVALSGWVNETVLLGDDGTEILRHRKMTSFRFDDGSRMLEEDTRLGSRLAILPTAVGDLAVVTCLDAFGTTIDRVRDSPASLLLVPSLSPSVSPHRAALGEAVRWLWGAAFVCNRAPLTPGDNGWLDESIRSFWTAAFLNRCQTAEQIEEEPVFEFLLSEDHKPDIK